MSARRDAQVGNSTSRYVPNARRAFRHSVAFALPDGCYVHFSHPSSFQVVNSFSGFQVVKSQFAVGNEDI